jgi:hypothetical protein
MRFYVRASGTWAEFRQGAWEIGSLRGSALVIDDEQVVGIRLAGIVAPSGGSTVDAEARTALGAILGALRTHGLIES